MQPDFYFNFTHVDYYCPYGFVGRTNEIADLLRLLQLDTSTIVIHGQTGIGKTTMVQKFLQVLSKSKSIEKPFFWFSFPEVRTIDYLFNSMGVHLFGYEFCSHSYEKQIDLLSEYLRANRYIIIWDNFDAINKLDDYCDRILFTDDEQSYLHEFLEKINGGKSKVLITSTDLESWISSDLCCSYGMRGLEDEDRWDFCKIICNGRGIEASRDDPSLIQLLNVLDGHPGAMRLILPKLEGQSASSIVSQHQKNIDEILPYTESNDIDLNLFAMLRFVEDDLSDIMLEFLPLFSYYEGAFEVELFSSVLGIYKAAAGIWPEISEIDDVVDSFVDRLHYRGIIRKLIPGTNSYYIHPMYTKYLQEIYLDMIDDEADISEAFVYITSKMSTNMMDMENAGKRIWFHYNAPTFFSALYQAKLNGQFDQAETILKVLSEFARVCNNNREAELLLMDLAELQISKDNPGEVGITYYQLGRIIQEEEDFQTAKKWFKMALDIFEKMDLVDGMASTHHQLGKIAQAQEDLKSAEKWYQKALSTYDQIGDSYGSATSYHELGKVGQEKRDYNTAKKWYQKSLSIFEMFEDDYHAAKTYNRLGEIANEEFSLKEASGWFEKAQKSFKKIGYEKGLAKTYRETGIIAQKQRKFDKAEKLFSKTIDLLKKQGDENGLADMYHKSGMIAQEKRDYKSAVMWYKKALDLSEKHGYYPGIAQTNYCLSTLLGFMGQYEEAGLFTIRSLIAYKMCDSVDGVKQNTRNFMINYSQAHEDDREKLKQVWEELIGDFPRNN